MNKALDLLLGDPVYDEQNNVIRRDFGVKNIVALMVVGFIGYSLMGEMKPISGKRKMKGGGLKVEAALFLFVIGICMIAAHYFYYLLNIVFFMGPNCPGDSDCTLYWLWMTVATLIAISAYFTSRNKGGTQIYEDDDD